MKLLSCYLIRSMLVQVFLCAGLELCYEPTGGTCCIRLFLAHVVFDEIYGNFHMKWMQYRKMNASWYKSFGEHFVEISI